MRIYSRYFKKYKILFITGVSCVLMEALCDLMQPTIMAHLIDDGVKNSNLELVIKFGLVMLIITAVGALFATTRSILSSRVSQRMGADLRSDLFRKILNFSESSADKLESGSLITRMTNDTSQITLFVNGLMRIYVKAPITCLGSIILSIILSPKLSAVLLTAVAIVTVFIVISMKLSYKRFAMVQRAIDKVNMVVQEYLMGVRLVKAFGRFRSEEEKFGNVNSNLADKTVSSQLVISYFSPLMSLTVNIGIVLIIYFGSVLFRQGNVEVGKVSAFINYMAQILTSLIMITNIFNTLVRTKASTERIKEILDSEEDFSEENKSSEICTHDGGLEFDNVTFAYPNGSGEPAIKNLSFNINGGETLAVIGPTGAGKSTLAWLIMRFYDTSSGTINFNGRDIKTMSRDSLRCNISVAPQKSMLFAGSVAENISWGKPNATYEEIVSAAKIAQADSFIENMPDQYESLLGQGAINLSGGQKQRISIARAMVKKARLVVLDDCTSALDAVTEARLREAIAAKSEKEGFSVIMITQRIGTACRADKILVLQNGEKAGFGVHSDLMKTCEIYRDIYDSQIGGEISNG